MGNFYKVITKLTAAVGTYQINACALTMTK